VAPSGATIAAEAAGDVPFAGDAVAAFAKVGKALGAIR